MEQMEREIGKAAGKIWKALDVNGPLPKSQIAKVAGLSPQVAHQGIGWLAREGKLTSEKKKKSEVIKLKE